MLALLAPGAAEARGEAAAPDDGKVTVGVKINRFAVSGRKSWRALSGRNIVARAVLTSRVEGAGQSQAARKAVTFAVAAHAGRCHVLTLTLDDLRSTCSGCVSI